jgi:hypothetical protein
VSPEGHLVAGGFGLRLRPEPRDAERHGKRERDREEARVLQLRRRQTGSIRQRIVGVAPARSGIRVRDLRHEQDAPTRAVASKGDVMASARPVTDHDQIRDWVEERGGRPACVKGTAALLRVDFGKPDDQLQEISWDDWFDTFEESHLAALLPDGPRSRFFKLVDRAANAPSGRGSTKRGAAARRGSSTAKRSGTAKRAGTGARGGSRASGAGRSAASGTRKRATAGRMSKGIGGTPKQTVRKTAARKTGKAATAARTSGGTAGKSAGTRAAGGARGRRTPASRAGSKKR